MEEKTKVVSAYNISQTKTNNLCLLDPMMLLLIIIATALILYIIEYGLKQNV